MYIIVYSFLIFIEILSLVGSDIPDINCPAFLFSSHISAAELTVEDTDTLMLHTNEDILIFQTVNYNC